MHYTRTLTIHYTVYFNISNTILKPCYSYGNTSSSSIWYEMDFIRNCIGLKRGQRVLQVAFGSGFKCNSAVWLCLKNGEKVAKDKSS